MNKVINMDRGQYTIIDDRPCDWPEEDWPEATITSSIYEKTEAEADAEARMVQEERQMCMVGPTQCSIDAELVCKRHRLPHRSHKFNRARKGVR